GRRGEPEAGGVMALRVDNIRYRWNLSGFEDVRRGPVVSEMLFEAAEKIAEASDDVYFARMGTKGRTRARAAVLPVWRVAQKDNAVNNANLRNLSAGRF